MTLRNVPYKAAYVSGVDNLVKDFYIPTLKESVLYQRRTGYFNSRALAMAARGLSGLIAKGGRMQLLCSVQLEKADEAVLRDPEGYLEQRALDVAEMLERPFDQVEKQRLAILAELLTRGRLEIKIGIRPKPGIYHEKAGIFYDGDDNIVAFNGSGNETPGGWVNNTESFHAYTSWQDDRHIQPELDTFQKLWSNQMPGTSVISLPKALEDKIIEFKDYYQDGIDDPIDPSDLDEISRVDWEWTPELAYIFEAPRLWNHHKFAYAETAITPFDHQDYVATSVLQNWPPRYLLCDEVGLGKTIEAGLIIKGFLAAGNIDRLLVLAPKNVTVQWQNEMKSKFGLDFWILQGNHVVGPQLDPNFPPPKEPVDAENPFRSKPLLLVSSQLIRSDHRREQLLSLEYDLVILDEAHHARARGPHGKRQPNKLLDVLEELRYRTQGLIMMTATPIQLDRKELWDLLNILELPGKWQDEENFDLFFSALEAEPTDWGFLFDLVKDYIDVYGLEEQGINEIGRERSCDAHHLAHIMKERNTAAAHELPDELKDALKLILFRHSPLRKMVFRNSRELLKAYRDLGKFDGKMADRQAEKRIVKLAGSPEDPRSEQGLYHRIDEYVREYYARYEEVRKGMGFLMVVYRKRLTSSLFAIQQSLTRRHQRLKDALSQDQLWLLFDELEEDDLTELPSQFVDQFIEPIEEGSNKGLMKGRRSIYDIIKAEIEFLGEFLEDLIDLPTDTKAVFLHDMLRDILSQGTQRTIIFSQFKDTVDFLLGYFKPHYSKRLGSYSGDGGSFWNGMSWQTCSKQEIQAKFADDGDPLSILVCTDAASEGLNLQTCNTLINYDIPWNPMRIEQRIGRVDRIGQEAPIVRVFTIFYEGTVEEHVYDRCVERIGFFTSTLGHLQPILEASERAIRQAVLAKDSSEEASIISKLDKEIEVLSIAQAEEKIKIDSLLNHFTPSLTALIQQAPITRVQLENNLDSCLKKFGWQQEGRLWCRPGQQITFDPCLFDQTGIRAEWITPMSTISELFGNLPQLPESWEENKRKVTRLEIDRVTGFIVESSGGFYIAESITDLINPQSQRYNSVDDAAKRLSYLLKTREEEFLQSQLLVWKNRKQNWMIRVEMYCDRITQWFWRSESGRLDRILNIDEKWVSYTSHPDRITLAQLIKIVDYEANFTSQKPKRGRVSKKSPRDGKKEEQLIDESHRITKRIEVIGQQLQNGI